MALPGAAGSPTYLVYVLGLEANRATDQRASVRRALLVSASLRQSGELFRKVVAGYDALGRPIDPVEDNAATLALA